MARRYHGEPASLAGAERLFGKAGQNRHDLKGAMADNSLEHELMAIANTDSGQTHSGKLSYSGE